MTDICAALLQAILDEPEDDTHRLVYADWLEGEVDTVESRARAEFIRIQIRLVREFGIPADGSPVVTGDKTADCEEAWLRKRERKLLRRYGAYWVDADPLWPMLATRSDHVTFTRGFISAVRCSCADWLTYGPAICRLHPVEQAYLVDKEPCSVVGLNQQWRWEHEAWGLSNGFAKANLLPAGIYDAVVNLDRRDVYHSPAEAKKALARWAAIWARDEARKVNVTQP